jgi:hypothetical protein
MGAYNDQTALRCDECGGRVILNDSTNGENYCANCGTLMEDSPPLEHPPKVGSTSAESSNSNFYDSEKSYKDINQLIKKYNIPKNREGKTMKLAKQQIRFHAHGWTKEDIGGLDKKLKSVFEYSNDNSFSNSRLIDSRYPAELMAATLAFVIFKIQTRQTINRTHIASQMLKLSQSGISPCGIFTHSNDPSLKNCIKKILRSDKCRKWKAESGNNPSLRQQLITKRDETLEDMVIKLTQDEILPIGFTIPLEVKIIIDETDYALRGNIVVSYHQELIYQIARKNHNITREELFIATEGFGGTPKFSNNEPKIKKILSGYFGGE